MFLVYLLLTTEGVLAQHYFFIEADGQQPFYVRWNGKLLSSSAGGFLLVPGVEEEKILLTVGFPMNKYPENNFELSEMNRDRGFQLKNFGDKGWGLFDRTSLSMIMPINNNREKVMSVSKPVDNSFATVLAEVTGDTALVQKKQEVVPPQASKKLLMAVSTPVRDSLIKDDKVRRDVIAALAMQETEEVKLLGFVVKDKDGKIDTVFAEISKPKVEATVISPPKTLKAELGKASEKASVVAKVPVCDKPFADAKDIRSLQRKILGSSDTKEQIAMVTKAYKERCYSTRQTMDLGWMVTDEAVRLQLFSALKGLVSDPTEFGQLETVFMKDENIAAFRKLMGKS
jgi:hypothetical protein